MDSKILVTKATLPDFDEYVQEISELWETHWLTNMGVKHQELSEQLRDFLEVDEIDLLTNGHMALELSIQAMELKGEVITTPFTFASTTHAIVRNGLRPVFCDIKEDDFTIDPEKIERLITDQTSAILPVHVYGNICDTEEIQRIAEKYGLKVIYDAAHAFGVRKQGRGIASFGDVSCFSFHATKVFNTIEGGAACFHDKDFGKCLYQLKNFGIKNEEIVERIGANAKMNEFCAAMGLCNLRHIRDEIAKRKVVTEQYLKYLKDVNGIQINKIAGDIEANYAYFPVLFNEEQFGCTRDEILETLQKHNIYPRKYFYPLTNMFDCYHDLYDTENTPKAFYASKRILTLPLYPDLPLDMVDRICELILKCKK
ncbi:DegT/DnrJ/EryC1/StrS family aminotransferase [Clostridiaceae bacterium]|nr:DegT/DnrJ/EryC1/StrS family aminotransferase [Clostridiaceae bacterium]RKI13624.1 DegT/DnrJ/EryC1/StrS family aminotransferase [bacterium 1XD21-70]